MQATRCSKSKLDARFLDIYKWGLVHAATSLNRGEPVVGNIFIIAVDERGMLRISSIEIPSLHLPNDVAPGDLLPSQVLRELSQYDLAMVVRIAHPVNRTCRIGGPLSWIDAFKDADRATTLEIKIGNADTLAVAKCPLQRVDGSLRISVAPLQNIRHHIDGGE